MERSPNSPSPHSSPRELRGKKITVMGLGAFGGGEGVVRYLSDRGARITLTDLKFEADLAKTLARLDGCKIEILQLGGHQEQDFREADLVVVNPAVPPSSPYLEIARHAGVELTSEMNLFIEQNRGSVAALTGSIGKSTTTALLERMLAAAGMKTWLGGNIGRSLLPDLESIRPEDFVVLELSSFQLTYLDRIQFRPDLALVTNLRPNHLDWHRDMNDYRWSKQTVLRYQEADDVAVLNADDSDVSRWSTRGVVNWFGTHRVGAELPAEDVGDEDSEFEVPLPSDSEPARDGCFVHDMTLVTPRFSIDLRENFALPGRHHALNAAAACSAAMAIGAGEPAIRSALKDFRGLPHRLQPLGTFHGRRFFDDSKATTPEAAIAALESFEEPVVLLAGGYDKQVDLTPFAEAIANGTKAVVLMGQTASELQQRLGQVIGRECPRLKPDRIAVAASFEEACRMAFQNSSPGDAVLLSPGCASYGWFDNYVERGLAFSRAVERWTEGN
jgi:UDP-N-acetylmuramoylalanine--D-glutamate ligase